MTTEQKAQDWLVSITPAPRGDWISPSGLRYNMTMHNGATAEMVTTMIAEMDRLRDVLKPANGNTVNQSARTERTIPPAATGSPPQGDSGGLGMEVYGEGFVAQGKQFVVEIDRIVSTASNKGNPTVELYRPGNQWKFSTVPEKDFGKLEGIQAGELTPPIHMAFRVGRKKSQGDNHYIDFLGIFTESPVFQPPAEGPAAIPPTSNQHPTPPKQFENLGMFKSWASQRGYTTTEDMIAAVGMPDLNVAIAANSTAWFESKMPPK